MELQGQTASAMVDSDWEKVHHTLAYAQTRCGFRELKLIVRLSSRCADCRMAAGVSKKRGNKELGQILDRVKANKHVGQVGIP